MYPYPAVQPAPSTIEAPRGTRVYASITYTISGTLSGPIWWPTGEEVEVPFTHTHVMRDDAPTLVLLVEEVLDKYGGDFSDTPVILADGILTITRHRRDGMGHVSRCFPLLRFPSIAEVTSDEWPTYPWDGEVA